MSNQSLTLREAFIQASVFLGESQVQDAAICAEMLLQHLLNWDRSTMLLRWDESSPQERMAEWKQMLARKAAGEPVQYIVGTQEFYGLNFKVNRAVLIPRPETELLVEQMIRRGNELWPDGSPLAVDIGSGSGAIPISIAVHCPGWRVMSSDISADALVVAQENARDNGVLDRIFFRQGDLLEPYISAQTCIDILVANLPYIAFADIDGLQPEVSVFEPRLALNGGIDGLILYRRMIAQMTALPQYPQLIGLEVGLGQADIVCQMLADLHVWERIEWIEDLAGIPRHVIAMGKI